MESSRKEIMARLSRELTKRNVAAGFVVQAAAQNRIRDYGLVDSGFMLGSITHDADADGVVIGSPIQDPPYPFFLHNGFVPEGASEMVGPFPFLTEGLDDARATLFAIYGAEMRL